MYQRILVPTDGSPLSKKAARSAVELARTLGAELVALNVGYELGVLSPRLFTMMVVMALVTTAMTGRWSPSRPPPPSRTAKRDENRSSTMTPARRQHGHQVNLA